MFERERVIRSCFFTIKSATMHQHLTIKLLYKFITNKQINKQTTKINFKIRVIPVHRERESTKQVQWSLRYLFILFIYIDIYLCVYIFACVFK